MSHWNPRFLAYAGAHGRTPEEMIIFDRARFPGGGMAGFLNWMSRQIQAFRKAHPEACLGTGAIVAHDVFDAFLGVGAQRS